MSVVAREYISLLMKTKNNNKKIIYIPSNKFIIRQKHIIKNEKYRFHFKNNETEFQKETLFLKKMRKETIENGYIGHFISILR